MSAGTTQANVSRVRQMLSVLFDLRPGDGFPLVILLAHSFLKGAARVLLETPANTLFLGRFSVDSLPLIYIATAVVCTVIGLIYTKLESRVSMQTLLTATLGFLAVITLVFYIALATAKSGPMVFGVMVWKDVHWTLMNLEFWALAGLLLDVRQGKRLFGMIALGEIIAGMIGGFSVPLFMKAGGTSMLLLISAATTIGNVFLLIYTFRRLVKPGAKVEESAAEAADRKPWWTLFKDKYLALFFGVSALSFFGEYFIDFLFYEKVEGAFPDEAKLASFFGVFYGVLGIGQLISSAWVSGRFLTRYGLSFGLLVLPAAALMTAGVASAGGMFQSAIFILFWAIVAAKFLDEVVRHTIEMPAYRILYQPLPSEQRWRVQTVRESMVEPLSLGLVGTLLWAGQHLLKLNAHHILYLTLVVALAWVILCVLLRREYTVRLTRALTSRRLDGATGLSLADQSSLDVLTQSFRNAKPGQVIYCLDALEENRHPSLEKNLVQLLDHPDALVRCHVLGQIERLNARDALEPVTQRLPREECSEVRAALLRTICALSEAEALERVLPFLKDPDPAVRHGVLVGLLRHCGIDGVLAGGSHLTGLLSSPDPTERKLAAKVLGDIGIHSFYRPLLSLLRDKNTSVRLAAIEAARKLRPAQAITPLVEALLVPALRTEAAKALVEIGEAALPQLENTFNATICSSECRKSIARICGRIATPKTAAFLKQHMTHPDGATRTDVLEALVHCHEKSKAPEMPEARALIAREAEEAAWALAAWDDVGNDAAFAELSRAFLGEFEERKQHIFLLLSLLYPPAVIRKARLDLETTAGEKKAHALEVLDNLLAPDLKKKIFPLLDNLSPQECFKQLSANFPQARLDRGGRLQEALEVSTKAGSWTKCCALFVAGRSRNEAWSKAALASLQDRNEMVRETAVWTLSRVDQSAFRECAHALQNDLNPAIARLSRQLLMEGIPNAADH